VLPVAFSRITMLPHPSHRSTVDSLDSLTGVNGPRCFNALAVPLSHLVVSIFLFQF
jgi:hypothetical protein